MNEVEESLDIDCRTGIVKPLKQVLSPNFDERPQGTEVDVLVIHAISLPPQCYGGYYVEKLFTNCLDPRDHPYFEDIHTLKVSSHFFIDRVGFIIQFVPTTHRAWHAGVSRIGNRKGVNDFSIGIELEGCDDDGFEDLQYVSLSQLTRCLRAAYPSIIPSHIVGHSDIAPGRKTDPGPGFDWQRYRQEFMCLDQ